MHTHTPHRLVSYELLYEGVTPAERMKVIISSQCLYFFCESPPDPSTITARYSLDDLAECRAAQGKTSEPFYMCSRLLSHMIVLW